MPALGQIGLLFARLTRVLRLWGLGAKPPVQIVRPLVQAELVQAELVRAELERAEKVFAAEIRAALASAGVGWRGFSRVG